MNAENVPVVTNYLKHYTENDFGLVFYKNIVFEKEIKLKEFNCFMAFYRVKRI